MHLFQPSNNDKVFFKLDALQSQNYEYKNDSYYDEESEDELEPEPEQYDGNGKDKDEEFKVI